MAENNRSKSIRQYRGLEINLPILQEGRIAFTTDTKKIFVGSADGNVEFLNKDRIDEIIALLNLDIDSISDDIDGIGNDIDEINARITSIINSPSSGESTIKNLEAQLPVLTEGIFGLATDSKKVFIGSDEGNVELAKKKDLNERGVSVKDFGAKGDGETDDTIAIQYVLDNYDNISFPDGFYRITNTLTFDGEQYDLYSEDEHVARYANKKIEFLGRATLVVTENVDGFILRGSSTTIEGMTIDVSRVNDEYTSSAFVLEAIGDGSNSSGDWSKACENNLINNLKICQEWGVKTGKAIRLATGGNSYIYRNKITNIDINDFYHGIYFDNNSYNGINANTFSGSIWASRQAMHVRGGGNIFTFNTQNTTADPENPELANVYCNGEYNQFIGLIYDVANEGLVKYAYEFGDSGTNNTITCYYPDRLIKNPHGVSNFFPSKDFGGGDEQFVLENMPNARPFEDFRGADGRVIPSKEFRMISGLTNALGRAHEVIESIDVVTENVTLSGLGSNMGDDTMRLVEMFNPNKLSSFWGDNLRIMGTDLTLPSKFQMTLNFKEVNDVFMIKTFGMMFGINSAPLAIGNKANITVVGKTVGDDTIPFKRFSGTPEDYHHNYQLLFINDGDVNYYDNQLTSLTLTIETDANILNTDVPITYLYANAVDLYGSSGSYAYIGGDTFGGDIEFADDAGLVLKTPSGDDYKLEVRDDGGIQWKNREDGSIINASSSSSVISVKDFGATGDGVTDDTIAIQEALDYFNTNFASNEYYSGDNKRKGRLVFPENNQFVVTDTITAFGNYDIEILGSIIYNGAENKTCFKIGSDNDNMSNCKLILNASTNVANIIAFELVNLLSCDIQVRRISGFFEGIRCIAKNSRGWCGNRVNINIFAHNTHDIHVTSLTSGWSNANHFVGGFFYKTNEASVEQTCIKISSLDGTYTAMDSNVFDAHNFEEGKPTTIPIKFEAGVYNVVKDIRVEQVSDIALAYIEGRGNIISTRYVYASSEYVMGSENQSGFVGVKSDMYKVYDSGFLGENTLKYYDTDADVLTNSLYNSSFGFRNRYSDSVSYALSENALFELTANGVKVLDTRGIIAHRFKVNNSRFFSFDIKLDDINKHSNYAIKCFDSNMLPLELSNESINSATWNSTRYIKTSSNMPFMDNPSIPYANTGAYYTPTALIESFAFEIHPNVAFIEIYTIWGFSDEISDNEAVFQKFILYADDDSTIMINPATDKDEYIIVGKTVRDKDYLDNLASEVSYGGKFEWRFNPDTNSLDLVVLD